MSNALELTTATDLERMAAAMSKSTLFGKNPDQILSLMLIAQAEGLHPATAVLEYDIIQGKPALKAQSALARFQRAGGKIEWKVRTDIEATASFSHPQSSEVTVTWNMEKAKRMGLSEKDNWKKQPGIMLQWRTVAEGVRICYPACLNRMYLVEEVQDFEAPKMRDVTPAKPESVPMPVEQSFELNRDEMDIADVKAIEQTIGQSAKIVGGDALTAARDQVMMLRDMAKSGGITREEHIAKLAALRDTLATQAAGKL